VVEKGQVVHADLDDPAALEFAGATRLAWARLIRKVYEVDPLILSLLWG